MATEGDDFLERAKLALTAVAPDEDLGVLEFGLTLIRAGNRLQTDLDTAVNRPEGMTWASFRVLFTIHTIGAVTPKQLARQSNTSAASISSVLGTLERSGMLERVPNSSDGRSVLVHLTAQGRRTAESLLVLNHRRMAQWAATLSDDERDTLATILESVVRAHVPPPEPRQVARGTRRPAG